jgi:hypothetical protein
MTSRRPPRLARKLLTRLAGHNDAMLGDLHEQFLSGRSRAWYWWQVMGMAASRYAHDAKYLVAAIVASIAVSLGVTVGWWGTRYFVPVLLGVAITSWSLWRLHRTSLVLLYVISIGLVLPHWMIPQTAAMTHADRVFWMIARTLCGYGVVGVLLVPFLILRFGRSGPLAEPPIDLSLTQH